MQHARRWLSGRGPAVLVVAALALGGILAPSAAGQESPADAGGERPSSSAPQSLPVGYDDYLVFVANGSWIVDEPHPTVPGCGELPLFCDGQYFQEQIMGRTAEEIAAKEQEAVEHFQEQFGIDVNDPANEGRLEFRTWMADPRFNYRVYSWGGRPVPPEGYEIRDGGWGVFITDPEGYTLGGKHEGVHVPAESMAFYGDYNILVTNPGGQPTEEVVHSYRADTFITPNQFGDLAFACQLSDDQFAAGETTGFAQGFSNIDIRPDGVLNLNIRNVLTFGPGAELRR